MFEAPERIPLALKVGACSLVTTVGAYSKRLETLDTSMLTS